MTAEDPRLPAEDAEWVPEDDTIIGRAFKISGVVLGAIALLIAAIVLIEGRAPEKETVEEAETVLPRFRAQAVTVPEFSFTDITREAGITFVPENGATGEKLLPETMGAGAAFFDFDDDGDPDLLLVNGAPWPGHDPTPGAARTMQLLENDGRGHFTDVTAARGLDVVVHGFGPAIGDADGDGDDDIFIAALGENRYFRNDGATFTEATTESGLGGSDDAWSTSAGFFDADGDGDLDLYVCNYVRWSAEIDRQVDSRLDGVGRAYGPPTNFRGAHPFFHRNDGGGRFTEVAAAAGLSPENPATGDAIQKALAFLPVDLDDDGDLDLVVANDTVQNTAFLNRGDGTFEEVGARSGLAYDTNGMATGAMGIDAARFRDGAHLGIAIGNFANEMTSLYVSEATDKPFLDEAVIEGIGAVSRGALTFGVLFLDVDLDGHLDLFQANGHLEEEISKVQPSQKYRQSAQLFWNAGATGGATFHAAEEIGDLATPIVGRAATSADIDLDGDPDLLLTQVAGPPLLLRNDRVADRHWLRVRLIGRPPNTGAIGAVIELEVDGRTLRRVVMPTRSYLAQVERPVLFGLGPSDRIDRLRITWPDGHVTEIEAPEIDRELIVEDPRSA